MAEKKSSYGRCSNLAIVAYEQNGDGIIVLCHHSTGVN